jgi:hypothetical protein
MDLPKISSRSPAKEKKLGDYRTLVKMSTCLNQSFIHWLVLQPEYFLTMEIHELFHKYLKYIGSHRERFPLYILWHSRFDSAHTILACQSISRLMQKYMLSISGGVIGLLFRVPIAFQGKYPMLITIELRLCDIIHYSFRKIVH